MQLRSTTARGNTLFSNSECISALGESIHCNAKRTRVIYHRHQRPEICEPNHGTELKRLFRSLSHIHLHLSNSSMKHGERKHRVEICDARRPPFQLNAQTPNMARARFPSSSSLPPLGILIIIIPALKISMSRSFPTKISVNHFFSAEKVASYA